MPTSSEVFQRVVALGLDVPPTAKPVGLYDPVTVHGDIAYTSGQLSRLDNTGTVLAGRMKADSTLNEASRAAKVCLLRGLRALHEKLGCLSRIDRFLFVRGFINADPDFSRHSEVMDGVSELIHHLFGAETGAHSRSALGAGSLPSQGLVEIEFTVALKTRTGSPG